ADEIGNPAAVSASAVAPRGSSVSAFSGTIVNAVFPLFAGDTANAMRRTIRHGTLQQINFSHFVPAFGARARRQVCHSASFDFSTPSGVTIFCAKTQNSASPSAPHPLG